MRTGRSSSSLMIQGTGSQVGKSFIVTGLCRLFRDLGIKTAPFKAQNMALNSYATKDGREIGRAQAVQAQAAGVEPTAAMNPILLKPTARDRFQVVLFGRAIGTMDSAMFIREKESMIEAIREAIGVLSRDFDLIIIEGAGSPAEINLARHDLANMFVARETGAPVVLVADIDRGGAFASLWGTFDLLDQADKNRITGFIINGFRGRPDVLGSGLQILEDRTGRPVLGVVPKIDVVLDDEDSVCLEHKGSGPDALLRLAVPRLPHISNFTDFKPFESLEKVAVDYVSRPEDIDRADAVIIPGTKNTISDCLWLHETGLGSAIIDAARSGRPVIGICGGLQILGASVSDPAGVEGAEQCETAGLDLLPIRTEIIDPKLVRQVKAQVEHGANVLGAAADGCDIPGYEIHAGVTWADKTALVFTKDHDDKANGWTNPDLAVAGSYCHGLFDNEKIRTSFLNHLLNRAGKRPEVFDGFDSEEQIDKIAETLKKSLELERFMDMTGTMGRAVSWVTE